MSEVFVNKVSESGILSIDLELYYPKQTIKIFDLKEYLPGKSVVKGLR